jgi:hypothetical protein
MLTLDELKKKWDKDQNAISGPSTYDQVSLEKIFSARVKKHMRAAMQYFWASFALQILVYALLSHVIVKFWYDTETVLYGVGGVLLFLPFTIMLMKKFKRMAMARPGEGSHTGTALENYVLEQHDLLSGFYRFKKRYELILIPLSSAIGVVLTFKLYVPGGVYEYPTGATLTFIITILSCALAIRSENKKSFEQPLRQLREILDEFRREI